MFKPHRLQLNLEAQSFKSNSNFLNTGSKDKLPSGFRFKTYDLLLSSMYDITHEWAMSTDLGLGYAESFDGVDLRSSRQIKDIKLGLWRLYESEAFGRIIFDGFYLLNFLSYGLNKDEVSVSDGVSWFQLGLWWEPKTEPKKLDKYERQFSKPKAYDLSLRTYLGFRSRSSLSDLLIIKVHPYLAYKKYIYGFEFNAFISAITEDSGAKINRELLNQRYNASIYRYNSWNPNLLETLIWAGYQTNSYSQIRGGISKTLGQKNTADGYGFFIDWQTTMTVSSTGIKFFDIFGKSKKVNPRNNNIEIKNYGPDPKPEPKAIPTNLQDL